MMKDAYRLTTRLTLAWLIAAIWKGLKEYTRKYWGKSVTTKDFQRAMQTASDKDLTAFFDKWVYLLRNEGAD